MSGTYKIKAREGAIPVYDSVAGTITVNVMAEADHISRPFKAQLIVEPDPADPHPYGTLEIMHQTGEWTIKAEHVRLVPDRSSPFLTYAAKSKHLECV